MTNLDTFLTFKFASLFAVSVFLQVQPHQLHGGVPASWDSASINKGVLFSRCCCHRYPYGLRMFMYNYLWVRRCRLMRVGVVPHTFYCQTP